LRKKLGLEREQYTTQISHYDNIGALCDAAKRINVIFLDLCKDFWTYISMEYFKQEIVGKEIGSSAMPHKVNPIDFENAEGNFGLANVLFEHMSTKLPISRLQRDLTDSTVLRNLGVPFSHTMLSFSSLQRGLGRIKINTHKIDEDLTNNWVVISEALQTILRREQIENPYEKLKDFTRIGEKITEESFVQFIDTLQVSNTIKEELKKVTPFNFIGQVTSVEDYEKNKKRKRED